MADLRFGKFQISGPNLAELRGLKREIFGHHLYQVDFPRANPTIIDAGAHVGLASLYFKTHWPHSRIIAVEPHPANLKYLDYNIWFNQLTNITVVKAALGAKPGKTNLFFDSSPDQWFSTAGFIQGAWDHSQTSASVLVPTVTLDSLITGPIDLLKLDIEGAELDVLRACTQLSLVDHLIIEIHPPVDPTQLIKLLEPTHQVQISNHHYGLKLLSASAVVRTQGFEPRTRRV